jgi:hypothetical protein
MQIEAAGTYYVSRLITAAALIPAICTAEKPPEVLKQSRLGLAAQKGQVMDRRLAGGTSGIFARSTSARDRWGVAIDMRYLFEGQTADLYFKVSRYLS